MSLAVSGLVDVPVDVDANRPALAKNLTHQVPQQALDCRLLCSEKRKDARSLAREAAANERISLRRDASRRLSRFGSTVATSCQAAEWIKRVDCMVAFSEVASSSAKVGDRTSHLLV